MNCANHPELAAAAYCRACGKPLCMQCARQSQGTVFCDEHVPAAAPEPPPPPPQPYAPHNPDLNASPGLAFLLGLIPGVGAIYNSQYAKGLIHAVVFGLLVSIVSSDAAGQLTPMFGIMIAVWVFYMALEAYHTANKRRLGQQVDEFSSLIDVRGRSRFPAGALLLIALGVLFLLNTMDVISFERMVRYWPILLILLGLYMLWARLAGGPGGTQEAPHERR